MQSKVFLFSSFAVIALLGIFLFVRRDTSMSGTKKDNPVPQFEKEVQIDVSQAVGKARLDVLSQRNQFVFDTGDDVSLIVSVSSDGKEVGGVDVLMSYDTSVLEYKSFEPLFDTFSFYTNTTKSGLVLTGVKKLGTTAPLVMKDTSLGLLKFKAKKQGDSNLVIHAVAGAKNETNINDVSGHDLIAHLTYPSLVVGETKEVGKKALSFHDISLAVKDIKIAPERCFDCISTVTITTVFKNKKMDLVFEDGGIVGHIPQPQQIGPYVIELGSMKKDSVLLHVFMY